MELLDLEQRELEFVEGSCEIPQPEECSEYSDPSSFFFLLKCPEVNFLHQRVNLLMWLNVWTLAL